MSCWGWGRLCWTDSIRTSTRECRWVSWLQWAWVYRVSLRLVCAFGTAVYNTEQARHRRATRPCTCTTARWPIKAHNIRKSGKKCYLYTPRYSTTRLSRLKDTEITWQRHLNGTIMVCFSLRYTLQKYLTFHSMNIVYKYLSAFTTLYTHSLSCLYSPTHNPYWGVRPHWSGT